MERQGEAAKLNCCSLFTNPCVCVSLLSSARRKPWCLMGFIVFRKDPIMDLHQGGGATTGTYPQEQPSSATPSPSHFQPPRHQHQLYNLPPHPSYSPTITLPPISTNTNSQYNDQESWPRSRVLQQVYQPQQSNIKQETMGKHIDPSSHARSPDDPMPSTSDFVKKLYKFVFFHFKYQFSFHRFPL